MLKSQAFAQVVAQLSERGDMLIIDTPPLLLTNDTMDLLDFADAVLLLVRDGRMLASA